VYPPVGTRRKLSVSISRGATVETKRTVVNHGVDRGDGDGEKK
jgi:hypothetical protein